jgi:predicted lipoprotein
VRILLTLCLLVFSASAARADSTPDYAALNKALTDAVVVPAYRTLADETAHLADTLTTFCAAPDAAGLDKAQTAFAAALEAWQHAQPFSYGPVTENGRAARFLYWPDKSSVGARQLRRALAARDPALLADGGLTGKSVALQSLAAVERILFAEGDAIARPDGGDRARYACALAAAMARFEAGLAALVLEQWVEPDAFRDAVLTAAEGNDMYFDAKEAATDLFKSLSGTLDAAVELKLERPLGHSLRDARPRRAESWRSRRSLANIAANLETARALFVTPGGFGDQLSAAGSADLDEGMRRSFDEAVALARNETLSLHDAVTDKKGRWRIGVLREKLKSLRLLIDEVVAPEIGLNVGFNARDGD